MAVLTLAFGGEARVAAAPPTYSEWVERCLETPSNRTLQGRLPRRSQLPLADFREVETLFLQALKAWQKSDLANEELWVGDVPKKDEFFDIRRTYYTRPPLPFQPFAQKFTVPPGSTLIVHGDFHGDIRSFIAMLKWLNQRKLMKGFRITNPRTYLVFLGDYADRGSYGVEVLYTLMRLKMANPKNVLMARGNHEDFQLTASYGFLHEGQAKYGRGFSPLPVLRMFDFLPVVLYIGTGNDFVQCNHGGMEPGYDPRALLNSDGTTRFQLLGKLGQLTFARKHPKWIDQGDPRILELVNTQMSDFQPQSPTVPAAIGFMWNDYSLYRDDPGLGFNTRRVAFIHGQTSTEYLLKYASRGQAKVHAVFRAHQHSGIPDEMMQRLVISRGAFRHWQNRDAANVKPAALEDLLETNPRRTIREASVWTFNVAPDSVYGEGNNYTFDTIGVVKTAKQFDKWTLDVVNLKIDIE